VKLFVATLLLVSAAIAAKIVVERVAPEKVASASDSVSRAKVAAGTVETVQFSGPGLRAPYLAAVVGTQAGVALSQPALQADRIRIVDALVARGHLDASAGEPRVQWTATGAALVDFPVEAGAVYVVRTVAVSGGPAALDLASVPTLVSGDLADANRIEQSAALLRGWCKDHGVSAKVTWTIAPDPISKQVDVTFTLKVR